MSTFRVVFDTDNSAFDEYGTEEIVRILRDIVRRIDNGEDCSKHLTIFDIHGNDVGRFVWLQDERAQ